MVLCVCVYDLFITTQLTISETISIVHFLPCHAGEGNTRENKSVFLAAMFTAIPSSGTIISKTQIFSPLKSLKYTLTAKDAYQASIQLREI